MARAKSKIDQTLLQTGKPKGTFSRGDEHPTERGFFYKQWCLKTGYENWINEGSIFFEKYIKHRLGKKKKRNPETLKALRTDGKIKFSSGDQHPKIKDYYFAGYDKGQETWISNEERKAYLKRKKDRKDKDKEREYNKLQWQKQKSDPEFLQKKAIRDKNYSQKTESKKRRNKVLKVWLSDPHTKVAHTLRNRINNALKYKNSKYASTTELLGMTIPKFKNYFEKLFEEGMTWENHGEWHIDHIVPCASFNLTKEEEQRKCFHYSNLQPLWAKDNLSKGSKIIKKSPTDSQ